MTFPVDPSVLPIKFAPAVRLWGGYAPDWGIPRHGQDLDEKADELYKCEWEGGGDMQHKYVAESAVEAGLGNFSKMMRNWAARVTGDIVERSKQRAYVLEVGSGAADSIIAVYKVLSDPEKMYATLLEPSKTKKDVIIEKLGKRGLQSGKHYEIITARDIDVKERVRPKSQDIVQQVATVHHHRNRDESFRQANGATKMGGFYVSGDWHSHIWMTPSMVYNVLLKNMEWPHKEEGMKAFLKAFPDAKEAPPTLGHYSANEVFTFSKYWMGWCNRRQREIAGGSFDQKDDFEAVEGHCPEWVYAQELNNAGYFLNTPMSNEMIQRGIIGANPDQIDSDHNLVIGMFAQKLRNLV